VARLHVLSAAVLFGTTGTAQALGPDIEPLAVGTARIAIGSVLLVLVALASGRFRLGGADRRLIVLSGACVAAYQATFFAAVDATGVAVGTVVAIGSAPVFTGLLARAFTGERLSSRWVCATAVGSAGVCTLVLGGSGSGGEVSLHGVGLALLAGAGYAGYAVAGKTLMDQGATPEALMASVFSFGAVFLLPLLALVPARGLLSGGGLVLAVYLGAVPTALAYILFARGLERIGAGETATLTLAEPVTAAAFGVVLLGERPGAAALVGAALVLAGLAMLVLRPGAPRRVRARPAQAPA
jgi:DME family drug/metabolite transporter